jgi:hypothetical protein
MRPWSTGLGQSPAGDDDCDGFTTTIENHVGTLPLDACAATPTANDEPPPDAVPGDFNNGQAATSSDVLHFSAVFNTVVVPGVTNRFDLNGDNKITSSDVLKFSPFFNMRCTP